MADRMMPRVRNEDSDDEMIPIQESEPPSDDVSRCSLNDDTQPYQSIVRTVGHHVLTNTPSTTPLVPEIQRMTAINDGDFERSQSISSSNSFQRSLSLLTDRVKQVVMRAADEVDLSPTVVSKKVEIDILTLGRAGVGKSQLLQAITKEDNIQVSPQLDHVTTQLTLSVLNVDHITYRFYDSRGIDRWEDGEDADKLIAELESKIIKPLFIIYCAAAGGRVETTQVQRILRHLHRHCVPIAYVITNMYAAADDAREAQIKGGIEIMSNLFENVPRRCGRFHYEYDRMNSSEANNRQPNGGGILIAVNSCEYNNEILGVRKYEENVDVLMQYIAKNLNDEQLSQFVSMTLKNRRFWEMASDALVSRVEKIIEGMGRISNALSRWFSELKPFRTRPNQ